MMANQEDLAILMTAEQGKPLAESRAKSPMQRPSSSGSRRKQAGLRRCDSGAPGDKRILVLRQPVGVVAAITPEFSLCDDHDAKLPGAGCGLHVSSATAIQTPYSRWHGGAQRASGRAARRVQRR